MRIPGNDGLATHRRKPFANSPLSLRADTAPTVNTSRFILLSLLSISITPRVHAAAPLTDRQEDAGEVGSTLQYAVPLTALALTYVLHTTRDTDRFSLSSEDLLHLNGSPRHDLLLAIGRSAALTEALKFAVNEKRPNGGDHSFPSGHTSFAFSGAEFIRKEYGWQWGIPAYLAAGYVGWSRVEANAHHTHDVLAGAAIGILANHDFGEIKTRYGLLSLQPAAFDTPSQPFTGLQLTLTLR